MARQKRCLKKVTLLTPIYRRDATSVHLSTGVFGFLWNLISWHVIRGERDYLDSLQNYLHGEEMKLFLTHRQIKIIFT